MPVKNLPTHLTIPVDADLIGKGTSRDSSYCIIAEAIKRALPNVTAVSVDLRTIRWSDKLKGVRYVFLTPVSAQQTIVDFDQGKEERIKPFNLRLRGAQIVQMRTESMRRQRREAGVRTPPTRRQVILEKDNSVSIIGGTPPRRSPISPSRERIFGARYLKP